jgi:hypothetical protein
MSEPFNDWAILELMGHRRLGGKVQDVEMFGARMCRIDIPDARHADKTHATQFYSAPSVYCVTPCSEETARQVAKLNQPAPVQRWELPPVAVDDGDSPDNDGGI